MEWKKWMAVGAACLSVGCLPAQTRVIAHRGYWKVEGSAQNSIESLRRAAAIGAYGTEFDVQMTKDKALVVYHDDSIQGRAICEADFSELKDTRLKNGETLPTLDDYLEAGSEWPGMQLILEIKPHRTPAAEDEVTDLVVRKVKERNMESRVEYISFSLHVCERLAQGTPGSKIAYLEGDMPPGELSEKGINGIDYPFKVLVAKPEWIAEAHGLGMGVNAWTVNGPERIQKMKELDVDYLTTDDPVDALRLLE